jgi:predicted HicB family RNase H-like nuclease
MLDLIFGQYRSDIQMAKDTKSAAFLVRMRPDVKAAAHVAAKQANRSLSALIETLLIEHCQKLGLLPVEGRKPTRARK